MPADPRTDTALNRAGLAEACYVLADLIASTGIGQGDITIHAHPRIGADVEIHLWPDRHPLTRPDGRTLTPQQRTMVRLQDWADILGEEIITPLPAIDAHQRTHPDPGLRQIRADVGDVPVGVRVWTRLDEPGRCTCLDCAGEATRG